MAKKKVKKVIKKVLDKTTIDEKIVAEYKENQTVYDTVLCHCKCYGGYLLAVGAGCTFGANIWWGLGLLVASGVWAYQVRRCKPCCKGGTCEPKIDCCKE